MNKRWGLLIIIVGFILLLLIVYFIFFYNFNPQINTTDQKPNPVNSAKIVIPTNEDKPKVVEKKVNNTNKPTELPKEEVDKLSVKRLSSAFAERYGSFSNQSDFGNVKDLEVFMTDSLRQEFSEKITELRANKKGFDVYVGITTKSLSAELSSYESGKNAEVIVHTRRMESSAKEAKENVYMQDLVLNFQYLNGSWKVSKVTWKEKMDT